MHFIGKVELHPVADKVGQQRRNTDSIPVNSLVENESTHSMRDDGALPRRRQSALNKGIYTSQRGNNRNSSVMCSRQPALQAAPRQFPAEHKNIRSNEPSRVSGGVRNVVPPPPPPSPCRSVCSLKKSSCSSNLSDCTGVPEIAPGHVSFFPRRKHSGGINASAHGADNKKAGLSVYSKKSGNCKNAYEVDQISQ